MGATISANPKTLSEQWFIVNATGRVLGRLASDIALVLRGKHMATYTPHVNMQTHVIVVNAEKVRLTGDKWRTKTYYTHSQYRGGLKKATATEINTKKPGELVRMAVQGMLPKNHLGKATLKRLRVFAGPDHPHQAQKPVAMPGRMAAGKD